MSANPIPLERRIGQLVKRLIGAPDLPAFSRSTAEFLEDEGLVNVLVGWHIAAPVAEFHDESLIGEGDHELAQRAWKANGWSVDEARHRIACVIYSDPGHYEFGVVCDGSDDSRPRIEELAELLGPLAETMFEKCHVSDSMQQLAHSEQLQSALFTIADMASSQMDLVDMLHELHILVGRFMYAENFYIALYDEQQDSLRFIYLKDTTDPTVRDANEFIPMSVMKGGLTWHVIRDGKPLMGTLDEIDAQLERPARDIGIDCFDWLGVPAIVGDVVRGVLVVQSYVERPRYTPADKALLTYVGSHIVTAVDRKLAREELERRVAQRTEELEHSVRLQKALFRIAELSHTARNLDAFYGAVHQVIGEFFDARNFYIAMLSQDGKMLNFPYFVDQFDTTPKSRPVGLGITEYGLRYGKPLKLDMRDPGDSAMLEDLHRRGEVKLSGKQSLAWLGVPLVVDERVVGLLAVQSYVEDVSFTERDRDILTFISYQIVNGLERQRAASALLNAYGDLERRVDERTAELSEQIEVRERIEQRLKHQVLHDSLTGLPNRAYLRDQLARAMAQHKREPGCDFAVLFIDLDRFKVINDSVGHLVGDALLKEVARRLSRCARSGRDMVARLGGDEFAIYMEVDGTDGSVRMAQRILDALSEPVRIEGKELFTGASVGIAMYASHYTSPEEILRDADIAMYRAKAGGRHRFELFDSLLHEQALSLLEVESDLRRGVTRHEFIPYFQPIVRLLDASIVGYEALMRWNHPDKGVLAPGVFLHVAEASGMMETLDWQIFERAMRVIPELLEPGQYVNLNFSPRHFRSPEIDVRFLDLIATCGVSPRQVRIEVTEGALLENPDQITAVFRRLHNSGVEIALDDFGTGYSSLSYLHRFSMHTLKIDRSFVCDLHANEERSTTAVVHAIMALAKSQRMEVVAEGIETSEQREALMALGCELGQGFYFARPQSLAAILASRQQD
ncbi:EAL domain-containing protein [Rhodanobacter sp. AS-Z3]|uniref:sensor domain-containing phosphodiesterase n=1 Tax=Rhodanobacter sp. AS-Z3 TaxID=3031330 RepID=UPI0024795A1C|nr:EAL domain-containing protein [Rhodanobacter sp. AS-Z3]WEN15084.1 EAL domain-containing protein [Rhodanobacter sp. AS-Z3]